MRHSTRYFKATLPLIIWLSILNNAVLYAQEWQAPPLRVRTEIHPAKVLLRWIPSDAKTWEQFNKYGVRLERLTIRRAEVAIDPPEILTLADTLRPVQSNELQQLVEKYPIGGVMAQAIWGENFEVGVSGKNELLRAMALEEANTHASCFHFMPPICVSPWQKLWVGDMKIRRLYTANDTCTASRRSYRTMSMHLRSLLLILLKCLLFLLR